jgi:hypothetical protein
MITNAMLGSRLMTAVGPDNEPRCNSCGYKLAIVVGRPWVIDCRRCKTRNTKGYAKNMLTESIDI